MIDGIPRISVYVVTYNQEDVIDRTLSSILSQLDYVYEICVSDDNSTDHTWDILLSYSKKYPGLFKLNRNNPNLGIFENTEKVWTMPTGDIVHDLAGDDCVGEGWFKTVVDYIQKNSIDYKNELFCIYGNYKCIYPNGDSFVFKNNIVEKYDAFSSSLRGYLCIRSACFSIKVLRQFKNVSQGRSHIAENAQDRQLQIYSKKNYYINKIGNIYYTNIGVSAHETDAIRLERSLIMPYTKKALGLLGVNFTKSDLAYMKYVELGYQKGIINTLKRCFFYIEGLKMYQLFNLNMIKRVCFAFIRRIPHNKPISF